MVPKTPRPRQQTLEAALGQSSVKKATRRSPDMRRPKSVGATDARPSPSHPRPSFLPGSSRKPVVLQDSSSEDDAPVAVPPKGAGRMKNAISVDDGSDGVLVAAPTSLNRQRPRKRAPATATDDSDEDDAIQTQPTKRRRLAPKAASTNKSSPRPESTEPQGPRSSKESASKAPSTPTGRTPRRPTLSARSAKTKQMELLRRRRAGEVIDEEDLSSSDDEDQKALYDTDSDHPVLKTFEDDAEEEPAPKSTRQLSKKTAEKQKGKKKKSKAKEVLSGSESRDEDDDNLDDFIDDDDDAPLGVPALLDIPLEFTAHAHKPLKEHFKDVIQWLVLAKLHPAFAERKHAVYSMAWRKLDDEVRGLAESKFSSSAWRPDFVLALRARPGITTDKLPSGNSHEWEACMACGRSNHPAKWVISLHGSAYHKNAARDNFLEDVESDSSSSDSESDSGGDYDENGNRIPGEGKRWFVGVVCNSNAETAHTLTHWKHNLKDWVDGALAAEGFMEPKKLEQREKMKPKKRYKAVDEVIETWVRNGVLKDLFQEFKQTLEMARNKSTTGKAVRGQRQ